MLKVENLSHRYPARGGLGPVDAVEDVNLSMPEGDSVALCGESGSGKTTILRLIAGFERVQTGSVSIQGSVLASPGYHMPPALRGMGMLFQDDALFPHVSVGDNVGFGLPESSRLSRVLDRTSHLRRTSRISEMLELVGMAGYEHRMPHELSGGQRQRVALARALAPAPSVLLMDEPFTNLDPALRRRITADVRRILRDAGVMVLVVTHEAETAFSLADHILFLRDGRPVQYGTPLQLYHQPVDGDVAELFGKVNLLPAEDGTIMVRPEDFTVFKDSHSARSRPGATRGQVVDAVSW